MKRLIGGAVIGALGALLLEWVALYGFGAHRIRKIETGTLDEVTAQAPGRFLRLDGRRVYVVEQGTGPIVVLVHGFGGGTFDWEETILGALAHHRRVVAIDLYGMGFSERDGKLDYGFSLWVEQLAGTLDALGIERATLIGHSLGTAVAAIFAASQPNRVDRLVLLAALAPPEISEISPMYLLMGLPGLGEVMLSSLDPLVPPGFPIRYQARAAAASRIAGTRAALLHYMRGTTPASLAVLQAAYPRIQAPTLFIHGTNDQNAPYAAVKRITPLVPNARLVTLEGEDHWLMWHAPDRLLSAIEEFLGSDTQPRT